MNGDYDPNDPKQLVRAWKNWEQTKKRQGFRDEMARLIGDAIINNGNSAKEEKQ